MRNPVEAQFSDDSELSSAESTLRLIATLPAPEGLEDRVQAALQAAPRAGRVLAWPAALRPDSDWLRSAAAAAIVLVVAGGGWGIYSHVQPGGPERGVAAPMRVVAPAGFSSAGAMRTPQTLTGPVVAHPATAQKPAKPAAKPAARTAQTQHRGTQPAAPDKADVQPVAPAAK